MAKLKDIAPAQPPKINGTNQDAPVWQLTLDHIEKDTGKLLKKEMKSFSQAGTSTHWFDQSNVLYSKLRPNLNKVIVPNEAGIATTELVPMCPNQDFLDRNYLAYYLRSPGFVKWISGKTSGAKMPRASMQEFWKHEIPLPPLKEQKRIAAILDKADAIRRKRQQAIELADQFLRSMFLDMFGDPVTNPKGWPHVKLGSILSSIDSGYSPKCLVRSALEEEIGVLKLSSVTSGTFRPSENKAFLEDVPIEKFKFVTKGNLLFSRKNTYDLVGATAIVKTKHSMLALSDLIFRLNITDSSQANPEYLQAYLSSSGMRHTIKNLASGAAGSMPNISKARLLDLSITLPPIEMQLAYKNLTDRTDQMHHNFTADNLITNNLFSSLSQLAFNGELTKAA